MSLFWQERRFGDLYKGPDPRHKPESRQSLRVEVNYLAHVQPDGTGSPFTCIICEISSGGAKLVVDQHDELPNEFTLVFRRRCRVVHRTDGKAGVQFIP
jgi:hypothetical protein